VLACHARPMQAQLQVVPCHACYPEPVSAASCTCSNGGCDSLLAYAWVRYQCGPAAMGWDLCEEVDGYIGWSARCVDDYNYGLITSCAGYYLSCGATCGSCVDGYLPGCPACATCIGAIPGVSASCNDCALHYCYQDNSTLQDVFGRDSCCQ